MNDVNTDHVFVESDIGPNVNGETDISCWLYLTYIYQRQEYCELPNMLI